LPLCGQDHGSQKQSHGTARDAFGPEHCGLLVVFPLLINIGGGVTGDKLTHQAWLRGGTQ